MKPFSLIIQLLIQESDSESDSEPNGNSQIPSTSSRNIDERVLPPKTSNMERTIPSQKAKEQEQQRLVNYIFLNLSFQ